MRENKTITPFLEKFNKTLALTRISYKALKQGE